MTDKGQKIILVTQRTRLEDLIRRYNTFGQAEFIISHNGGDFSDYRLEHETYHSAVHTALSRYDENSFSLINSKNAFRLLDIHLFLW